MAAATCQFDDGMGRFTGMADLRGSDMSSTSAPNPIYASEMGRNVPPIAHMSHGAPPPMSTAAPPGPSHYSAHQIPTLGATSTLDERMNDPEMTMKAEKDAIYKHDLYPLLDLVFQKCELATCTPRDPAVAGGGSDVLSSESFNDDIACFAQRVQEENRPWNFDTSNELDNLMILAIQVLRFHLLELEKVHELCQNFTSRYINCLKGKMPIDLVNDERTDGAASVKMDMSHEKGTSSVPSSSGLGPGHSSEQAYFDQQGHQSAVPHGGAPDHMSQQTMMRSSSTGAGHHVSNNQQAPNSVNQQPMGTHLSQQNTQVQNQRTTPCHPTQAADASSPTGSTLEGSTYSGEGGGEEDSDPGKKPPQKKRGIFPKQATNIMRTWLFQNLTHPYPSEEQKKSLANQTGLTILQVNNWFINARRRIVQPMIDQSNRAAVNSAMGPYSPDGQPMAGYLMDSSGPIQMRHPGWPTSFQGMPSDIMSQHISNASFNPGAQNHPGAVGGLPHQLRPPPSAPMLLPAAGMHHAAAAMMMPHHPGMGHPHHSHPVLHHASQTASMNPADMSSHMLGPTC